MGRNFEKNGRNADERLEEPLLAFQGVSSFSFGEVLMTTSRRLAKLKAIEDSQLSRAAKWQKYHFGEGDILDMRAVLR